jgi:hypothetical protein
MTMTGSASVFVRGLIALAVCAVVFNSGAAMAIEEPAFELIEKTEPYEIRQYRPFVVAETFVDGDLDKASSAGFRLIADYIFGNNLAVSVLRCWCSPGSRVLKKCSRNRMSCWRG